MTMLNATVKAHKGIGLNLMLSGLGGLRQLAVGPGQSYTGVFTGDQLGEIRASLAHQRRHERLGPDEFGGEVIVHTNGYGQVPVGSKAWLRLVADASLSPSVGEMREALVRIGRVKEKDAAKVPDADVRRMVREACGLEEAQQEEAVAAPARGPLGGKGRK